MAVNGQESCELLFSVVSCIMCRMPVCRLRGLEKEQADKGRGLFVAAVINKKQKDHKCRRWAVFVIFFSF